MKRIPATVTIELYVYDEEELRKAAHERALRDGTSEESWKEMRIEGGIASSFSPFSTKEDSLMPEEETIIEYQQTQPHDPEYPRLKSWRSEYIYIGPHASGNHIFQDSEGRQELFAERENHHAGWHLGFRGKFYEFCSSLQE
jgi:hypothetical protein